MARTSKRPEQAKADEKSEIIWSAGIYARLSVDSNARKNESIDTQIQIAKNYIGQFDNMKLFDCYIDLGKTGTNFKRDGFERMMIDIQMKRINCIIVKDFSRLGRNYIETGNYIERIFPFMRVRFIAVADHFDSERDCNDNVQLTMNLKNIINELYAEDIAQRVKNAKKIRQETGNYTGGIAPYGYYVETVDRRKQLLPEKGTKDIVLKIFEMFANGRTYKDIIEFLYIERIQPPKDYHLTKQIYCPTEGKWKQWNICSIKGILTNPAYIGTLFQARTYGKDYKTHKLHEGKEEAAAIAGKTHEPIVSEELFKEVLKRFEKQRKYSNNDEYLKKLPKHSDIFQKIIYCGDCGSRMLRNASVKALKSGDKVRRYDYFCPNRKRIDNKSCKCRGISEKKLYEIVKTMLNKEFFLSDIELDEYKNICENETGKKRAAIEFSCNNAEKKLERLSAKGSELYFQYRTGQILQETFICAKRQLETNKGILKEEISARKEQIQKMEQEKKKNDHFIDEILEFQSGINLNNELLRCLIKQINICSGYKIEVIFNYKING